MRCAHAHSYNLYYAHGLPQGSYLKKKLVSGSSFIRGKSVKEGLITNKHPDSLIVILANKMYVCSCFLMKLYHGVNVNC